MYCNVLVTRPFDHPFTYKIRKDQSVKIGNIVEVPFGKKKDQIGIIYEFCSKKYQKDISFEIKEIENVYEDLLLNKNIIKFINWIADYTLAPKGLVLKLFLVSKNIVNYHIKAKAELSFIPKS